MGVISDNLTRSLADSNLDLTGFVWRGPGPTGMTAEAGRRDATPAAEPGPRTDAAPADHRERSGRQDDLGFVARRATS